MDLIAQQCFLALRPNPLVEIEPFVALYLEDGILTLSRYLRGTVSLRLNVGGPSRGRFSYFTYVRHHGRHTIRFRRHQQSTREPAEPCCGHSMRKPRIIPILVELVCTRTQVPEQRGGSSVQADLRQQLVRDGASKLLLLSFLGWVHVRPGRLFYSE